MLCRIFWALVVVSSIVFFTVQVCVRVQEYFRYKTNSNVERVLVDELAFPAVTICNQNAYRMTKAVNMELYDFLDAAYMEDNNLTRE